MAEAILVIGGTGLLGQPVARRLAREGFAVRVLTRDPAAARTKLGDGFELFAGDARREADLEPALVGCVGAHLSICGGSDVEVEPQAAVALGAAARRAGLRRVTYVSDARAFVNNSQHPHLRAKLRAEEAIRRCGVPYTVLKASVAMETLGRLLEPERTVLIGRANPILHWLAADDLAEVVVKAYAKAEAVNRTFVIWGPESRRLSDALAACTRHAERRGSVLRVPTLLADLAATLSGRADLRQTIDTLREATRVEESGDPTDADAVFGMPPTTLEAWCQKRREPS